MTAPGPGDIGLVTIRSWVGTGIRIGQWLNGDGFSRFEHAFVVVEGGKIVEARPHGAKCIDNYRHGAKYLRCPDQYRTAVAAAAMGLVGTPYSKADYFALAAVRLHLPSKWIRAYVASSKHMICSQLADEAARRGGWHLFNDGRLSQDVTPGDLYSLTTGGPVR